MVGLLLPPSVPGALVNFAALLMGKVPVNLNYTVSEETLASCIRQCGIKTVLTSRVFLEKVKLKVPGQTVLLEEVAAKPGSGEKLWAMLSAWLLPASWLERSLGREKKATLDDLATIIFSSGSTGDPKGVMLSHYNVGSNIEQIEQIFGLNRKDGMVGVLPFFHSFGFTGTLWLPAVLGVRVVYHPNPARSEGHWPPRQPLRADLPARHADVPAALHARLLGGRFRQPARRDGGRRETARAAGHGVRGAVRHPPARRLRLHGVLARCGREHA